MKRPSFELVVTLGLVLLIVTLILIGLAAGEVLGAPSISVTSTSATVTLTRGCRSLTLINDSASANELYTRVFWCGETTGAATTSSPVRLEPGESVTFNWENGEGGNGGYCAFAAVTAATETATMRYLAK
jgi:hypothetical protein